MNIHQIKTHPEPFQAIFDGAKNFEFRLEDRTPRFETGDRLLLLEYEPDGMVYTGRAVVMDVTYVLRGPAFGVPEGFVCMSIRPSAPYGGE